MVINTFAIANKAWLHNYISWCYEFGNRLAIFI